MGTPEQIVERAYGHFARGEVAELIDCMHPDVEWVVAGESGDYGGSARGRAAVEDVFVRWMAVFSEIHVRPLEFHLAGDSVFVVGDVTAVPRGGTEIRSPVVQVFEVKDGLITRFRSYAELGAQLPATSPG